MTEVYLREPDEQIVVHNYHREGGDELLAYLEEQGLAYEEGIPRLVPEPGHEKSGENPYIRVEWGEFGHDRVAGVPEIKAFVEALLGEKA